MNVTMPFLCADSTVEKEGPANVRDHDIIRLHVFTRSQPAAEAWQEIRLLDMALLSGNVGVCVDVFCQYCSRERRPPKLNSPEE